MTHEKVFGPGRAAVAAWKKRYQRTLSRARARMDGLPLYADLRPSARDILRAVRTYRPPRGEVALPTVDALVEVTGYARGTVSRSLIDLRQRELLP